jgi:glycosyltransferase involved in cell wall biosynthesis
MRILFVSLNPLGYLGGNAHFYFPSCVAKQADVLLLCPQASEKTADAVIRTEFDFQYTNFAPGSERIGQLLDTAKAFKPDVVHIFRTLKSSFYASMLKMRLSTNLKVVVDIRSPLLAKGLRRIRQQIQNQLLPFVCDAILTHSLPSVATHIPFCWKSPMEIPLGVELSAFPESQKDASTAIRRFVFVGSLHQNRNIDVLLHGFAAATRLSKEPITLDIFGTGPAYSSLLALSKHLGMEGRITFHGAVVQPTLFQLLGEYDAGIGYVPNGAYDSAPSLKVLEYAAAGLAILASDTEGHREFVRRGFNLQLVDNSSDSLALAIIALIGQRADSCRESQNRNAAAAYDWQMIVDSRLIPLYQSLVR